MCKFIHAYLQTELPTAYTVAHQQREKTVERPSATLPKSLFILSKFYAVLCNTTSVWRKAEAVEIYLFLYILFLYSP